MKRKFSQERAIWGLFLASLVAIIGLSLPKIWLNLAGPDQVSLASLTGEYDPTAREGVFLGRKVISPQAPVAKLAVLGTNTAPKRIEVDLTKQRLYAFEGDQKVYDFAISSGKWYPTPTGTFQIASKFRSAKMSGGNPALHTYYYLPNVPYIMFFGNDKIPASRGFSLHGTYWHDNFGHPMSHGCVNMKTEEAELIYYWSSPAVSDKKAIKATTEDPGTTIVIYGKAPRE